MHRASSQLSFSLPEEHASDIDVLTGLGVLQATSGARHCFPQAADGPFAILYEALHAKRHLPVARDGLRRLWSVDLVCNGSCRKNFRSESLFRQPLLKLRQRLSKPPPLRPHWGDAGPAEV